MYKCPLQHVNVMCVCVHVLLDAVAVADLIINLYFDSWVYVVYTRM